MRKSRFTEQQMADVARSLDGRVNTLHGSVRNAKTQGMATPRRRSPEHEEIARLRRERRDLTGGAGHPDEGPPGA